MSKRSTDSLASSHVIVSCEGAAEEVIMRKLAEADALVFPSEHIISITRKRKASDIQDAFLGYDYDWPVSILRIHDSRKESFRLGALYRERFSVVDVLTRPEIDVLAIIREGAWERWKRAGEKADNYCKSSLNLRSIKNKGFLEDYWDVSSIAEAATEYRRLSNIPNGALCLADIIRWQ